MNTLTLLASVAEISAQRYTPAGLPAIELQLEHQSSQIEAGGERVVKLQIRAIGLGAVAEILAKASIGRQAKFKGFLTSSKNGKGCVLHITDIEFLNTSNT